MADGARTATELRWGRHYAAVRPDHFSVAYQINPYMDVSVQPDVELAARQWESLVGLLGGLGARVEVLPQRPDSPDMVYAMNLGLALGGERSRVVMSHMRYPERRLETETASRWFAAAGFDLSYVGQGAIGPHLEAGDAFPFAGSLVVGFGPRTEKLALDYLAVQLGVRVVGVEIVHPAMYHLDLAFCPLDDRSALVCLDALGESSQAAMLGLVPEPILITEQEALTFCANSVVVGRTIVMPACPDRVRGELEAAGFEIVLIDVSEFHKAGGSIRCLTNPLDIELGRDLTQRQGGEVVLPAA